MYDNGYGLFGEVVNSLCKRVMHRSESYIFIKMSQPLPFDLLELQLRIAQDDQTALKMLYSHFNKKLFHLAFGIVHSRETAEEIVEDVFVQIWNKRVRISSLENLTWYLYVTTRNISYNYSRKLTRKKYIDIDDLETCDYTFCPTPEQIMISRQEYQLISDAINKLPAQCKLIFKLVKEDNLRYQEVANLLQLRIKTVENQMGIALKKVYSELHSHFPQSVRVCKKNF